MAVRQVNSYVSKVIELWHLGYDAQLVITCVEGHMGINLQQGLLACEIVSHRYSQNEHPRRKPTQPHVHRRQPTHGRHQQHPLPREQHPPSREQPAKRRRREKRAFAMAGKEAAQVPSSQHPQLPVQPGATSHAPPAATPSLLPPWHDRHPPLLPRAEQAGEQQHHHCPQPSEEVSHPHSPFGASQPVIIEVPLVTEQVTVATDSLPPLPLVKQPGQTPPHPSVLELPPLLPIEQSDHHQHPPQRLPFQPVDLNFKSFCFQVPSLQPSLPSITPPPRRAGRVMAPRSKTGDPLVIRKPGKYLKTVQSQNIERAVWMTTPLLKRVAIAGGGYGGWVEDVSLFVRFVDLGLGLYTEPCIVYDEDSDLSDPGDTDITGPGRRSILDELD